MAAGFGEQLRDWRRRRGLSQLQLSGLADVSTRHLSWLESGRAAPSRAMVLRLAERLDIPLRERNGLLAAAGFAPLYGQRRLDDPADPTAAALRATLQQLLDAHEPWPALAVDRHWRLVAHNRLVPLLMSAAAPELLQPPVNVLRLSLHPQGLAPRIANLADWRAYVLMRLRRQVVATGDEALVRLRDELAALPPPPGHPAWAEAPAATAGPDGDPEASAGEALAVPLSLDLPQGRLRFLTTVTVFGAPRDVTLSELAVETLLPADAATAESLRRVHAGLAGPAGTPSPPPRLAAT